MENNSNTNSTTTKKDFVFMPITIWILVWIFNFKYLIPSLKNNWESNSWIYVLILFITYRLALCIWTVVLCKQHKLNTNLWTLLAFIFGINQLLFINIRIWVGGEKTNTAI